MAAGPGPEYSFDGLVQIWLENSGGADQANVAAAIALAESGGCRYALAGPVDVRPVKQCRYNHTDGANSQGLWQINIAPGAHPEWAGYDLFDPDVNATAAITISQHGTDWSPWVTYESGAYLAYLPGTDVAPPASTGDQPPAWSTPVLPGSGADLYPVNPVRLGDAWAMATHQAGRGLPAVWQGVVEIASHMGRVVR
jgi:Lysozyme like domain